MRSWLIALLVILFPSLAFAADPCEHSVRKSDSMSEVQENCGPPAATYVETFAGSVMPRGYVPVTNYTIWKYESERGRTVLKVRFYENKVVKVHR
jgi:hypothetical protein